MFVDYPEAMQITQEINSLQINAGRCKRVLNKDVKALLKSFTRNRHKLEDFDYYVDKFLI